MNNEFSTVRQCDKCDAQLPKAHRIYQGLIYCGCCYQKHFVPSACTKCHRPSRILRNEAPHECPSCLKRSRWEGRSCARCHRQIKRFGIELDGDLFFCLSCKRHALPPKLCPGCNELKIGLCRDLRRGVNEPVCSACRYRLGKSTCCAGCHRPRFMAGEREGKQYCANCLPTGAPPIVTCSDCHKPKYHFGSGRCEDCAWLKIHSRLLERLNMEVPHLWARELMAEYYQTLRDHIANGTLSRSLRHDATFFSALCKHFDSMDALSGVAIIRKLGHEFLTKHGRVMSFLNVTGHITTYQDPDYLLEWHLSRIRSYAMRGPAWSQAALNRFLSHMLHKRDLCLNRHKRRTVPVKPKSMESAVRSAVSFLAFAAAEGATCLPEVSQEHLDLFLGKNRNHRMRIRAFLRYLRRNERTFQKLAAPPVKQEFSLKNAMSDHDRFALINRLAESTTVVDLRWSIVALFALIYAQHPHKSVGMALDRVRVGKDDVHEVLFANVWMPLDDVTNRLMDRWLSSRRENSCFERNDESAYLFPGRQAGSHMRSDTFAGWIRSRGTTARSLVTTSLATWAKTDVDSPRILVDALGISRATATNYFQHLGLMLRPHARHALEART